jgi:hypothetical protein
MTRTPTDWRRLRLIEAQPESRQDKARRLAEALDAGAKLSDDDRRSAAGILRSFADMPERAERGRPRNSAAPFIALDYLVHVELYGKAAAAAADVAQAWGKSERTVEDAWNDWQHYARSRLAQLTEWPGRQRDELLRAISADLRESHAARKKAVRKK